MAEPPSTVPAEVAASGQDALLTTKLHVPRPQPGFAVRPRLLRRLDEGLTRGLLLVCAPAGFGKTALLADWAHRQRRPVAWLSLDTGDNDPARFWRHVAATLDRARPGVAERVAGLVGSPAPASLEGLVTALINQLSARPTEDEVVLVLDDYHLIDARQVHGSLRFLLEHLPAGLRLVLTSRADPPLPLARLRARGQLAELRHADLRFTTGEAAELLHQAIGSELPDAAVATLAARTEGWAAGLQLAALSLRGQPDAAGFVAAFSGSHRYVLDYLAEEVLDRQPEPIRAFLLETSVLERLSGGLCDAVTGRADGQAMLEQLERANLFLQPLDEVRGWWRYHQLFADLLRARLQQQAPERAPELHRAAAAWCEERGLPDDAARHALAAGDGLWASRLVERHADELLWRGEGATLGRWLGSLPPELVDRRPRLLLAQARLALLSGRVDGVEGLLDAAEQALADTGDLADGPYEPSVGRAASLLANVPATIALDRTYLAELRGDAEGAIALAERARGEIGQDEWMLASHAGGYLGVAEWLRGRLGEAERLLSTTITQWRAAGQRSLAVRGCHHLGQVQRSQGRLDAALETYRLAVEIATASGRPPLPAAGIGHAGMAEVAYERDDLDTALRQVTEGIPLCRQLAFTQPLASALATLAWIRQAEGDADGALDAIDEAERVANGPGVTTLLNPVPAQRARLLLAQGDVTAALRWAQDRGLGPDDEPARQREPEYLVLARALLARDLPGQALRLLTKLLPGATAQGRTGDVIELRALEALALTAGGEEAAAQAALAEALALASRQGHVRVFADEGAPMGALLDRFRAAWRAGPPPAGEASAQHLARVLEALRPAQAPPRPGRGAAAAIPGLIEPLTTRELEVLELLARGRPNRRIAEELVVTLDTVKKHVSHILDKLGAANRTEAVARARDLGLLGELG
jgi:LuxR family maltose regulon positive regulatory protein